MADRKHRRTFIEYDAMGEDAARSGENRGRISLCQDKSEAELYPNCAWPQKQDVRTSRLTERRVVLACPHERDAVSRDDEVRLKLLLGENAGTELR